MGFIEFIFACMLIIPVALLMWFLLNKLSEDMKTAARRSAEEEAARKQNVSGTMQQNSRKYAPGYNRPRETQVPHCSNYEARSFGSSAAEIRRREQEKRDAAQKSAHEHKIEKPEKELSKRKRRKARKQRKKDKEQQR
ncbi:MAG: hypothetical protein PUF60_04480 [Firmicutes bacterium]|nr:hypothetical protein [Bacillota bacterium]